MDKSTFNTEQPSHFSNHLSSLIAFAHSPQPHKGSTQGKDRFKEKTGKIMRSLKYEQWNSKHKPR